MSVQPPVPPRRKKSGNSVIRTLGIGTLLYAIFLLLYGAASAAMLVALPGLDKALGQVMQEQQKKQDERREAAIKELEEQEAAATSDEERGRLRAERVLLSREPSAPEMPVGMGLGILNDTTVQRYSWGQIGLMLVLNLGFVLAGIGLMMTRSWGRLLSLGLAALKIVALVGTTLYYSMSIAPVMAKEWTLEIEEMINTSSGVQEMPAEAKAEMESYADSMSGVFSLSIGIFAVLGLIHPILLLVLLNRPKVRAAFEKAPAAIEPA